MRTLLEAGANIDALTADGCTPLMCAAAWGFVSTVQILLDAGTSALIRDHRGASAEDIAGEKGMNLVARLDASRIQ